MKYLLDSVVMRVWQAVVVVDDNDVHVIVVHIVDVFVAMIFAAIYIV